MATTTKPQDQFEIMTEIAASCCSANVASNDARLGAEKLTRMLNYVCAKALDTLDALEHLTSEQFANGGDREIRGNLVAVLHHCGQAAPEQVAEYASYLQ